MKKLLEVFHPPFRSKSRKYLFGLGLSLVLLSQFPISTRADDLESLDGTTTEAAAPATGGANEADVAVDLGADPKSEDFFNPYTFARTQGWVALPALSLILLGLHLLPIPKRRSRKRIDQAQRFFRGISGENTSPGMTIEKMGKSGSEKN